MTESTPPVLLPAPCVAVCGGSVGDADGTDDVVVVVVGSLVVGVVGAVVVDVFGVVECVVLVDELDVLEQLLRTNAPRSTSAETVPRRSKR